MLVQDSRCNLQPRENFEIGRNEIVVESVSPCYISPLQGLQRLEKNAGGIRSYYMISEPMLKRGLELLSMLKEDLDHIGVPHHRVKGDGLLAKYCRSPEETRC